MKDGWDARNWHLLTDHQGRPVGKFQSPSAPMREQLQIIRDFLISLQKGYKPMAETKSKNEKKNMLFLAGTLKFDPRVYDKNVRALIDVGMKSAIQVSIYTGGDGGKELADKLKRFREGDFIQLVCMLRPYGTKDEESGKWTNSISIDITEIRNEPPQRQKKTQDDDDVPY